MSNELFKCPRRMENPISNMRYPEDDHWRADDTCSYCGSISPAKLFEAIELECEIGPTDKQYKIYVDLIEPNPDELRVVSAITFDPPTDELESGKWLRADPATLQKDGWSTGTGYKWMQIDKRGPKKFGKFYFQHLSEPERRKFYDLYIAKKMTIGDPGYFYVLPFFMTRRKL